VRPGSRVWKGLCRHSSTSKSTTGVTKGNPVCLFKQNSQSNPDPSTTSSPPPPLSAETNHVTWSLSFTRPPPSVRFHQTRTTASQSSIQRPSPSILKFEICPNPGFTLIYNPRFLFPFHFRNHEQHQHYISPSVPPHTSHTSLSHSKSHKRQLSHPKKWAASTPFRDRFPSPPAAAKVANTSNNTLTHSLSCTNNLTFTL
jgi:hypothetical protein